MVRVKLDLKKHQVSHEAAECTNYTVVYSKQVERDSEIASHEG